MLTLKKWFQQTSAKMRIAWPYFMFCLLKIFFYQMFRIFYPAQNLPEGIERRDGCCFGLCTLNTEPWNGEVRGKNSRFTFARKTCERRHDVARITCEREPRIFALPCPFPSSVLKHKISVASVTWILLVLKKVLSDMRKKDFDWFSSKSERSRKSFPDAMSFVRRHDGRNSLKPNFQRHATSCVTLRCKALLNVALRCIARVLLTCRTVAAEKLAF